MKLIDTYLGFTNDKKPMQAARIEKSLDMLWRMKNGVFSRKQIVFDLLQEGRIPSYEENYSYYSARIDGYTKPRTLYKLEDEETGRYLEINKTLYDFANYIIENGFLDIEKAKQFIHDEQEERKRIEEEERQKEIKIQQEKEEEQKQREIKRKKRQQEYNEKHLQLGKEFIQRLEYDPIKQLLDENVPKYIELDEKENRRMIPKKEKEQFYNNMYNRLTILLGDFNYCNHLIKRYAEAYKNNEKMKIWEFRNMFLYLEQRLLLRVYKNVNLLNDHTNTINAKMKAIYNGKEYKAGTPIKEYEFYYLSIEGDKREYYRSIGQKFEIEGITFYLRTLEDGTYSTIEEDTGMIILRNYTNKKEIIQQTREAIQNRKDRIKNILKHEVELGGGTPLYKEKQLINN